ncbi:MAG TPA: hypothetical protein VJ179_00595 [Patescibacteria group bacterium]|nr:hypothetical protein [Patescibacteria group bacterium]
MEKMQDQLPFSNLKDRVKSFGKDLKEFVRYAMDPDKLETFPKKQKTDKEQFPGIH